MKDAANTRRHLRRLLITAGVAMSLMLTLWGRVSLSHGGGPSTPLNVGYLDFPYAVSAGDPVDAPTGEKAESKLWWNDGFWWGSLYNNYADEYHIYRLNWGTQTWEDTGVALDDRRGSKADTMWDQDAQKLYVVSHIKRENSARVKRPVNWGRLYRYSYDASTQSYALDNGFPVTVNEDKTETLILAKDSTGRLWIAYVSRDPSVAPTDYQVYVNASDGNDENWGTPFSLGDVFQEAHVDVDDIASVVAFRDNGGDQVGIMWSNQLTGTFHFATHPDSTADPQSGWSVVTVTPPNSANDHISVKPLQTNSSGYLFAAVKTSAVSATEALIGLIARDENGNFSFHPFSDAVSRNTRPTLLIDEDANKVYIFVTGKPSGNIICYKAAAITSPLSNMSFPTGHCGEPFIADDTYNMVDNATSTKQNVNRTTGIVVIASDDENGWFYAHNVLGDPPPVVTYRSPAAGAENVSVDAGVKATFSKAMNASTLNDSHFQVRDDSGPIAGTVAYDNETRTATFTPHQPLKARTAFTVTLDTRVKDTSDQPLYGAPETWSFTTGSPTVQFAKASFSVAESAGLATITVTLNTPSAQAASVKYTTSDGTATFSDDYSAAVGTLKFTPGEISKTFLVTIYNDDLDEFNETVSLALSNADGAILGTPSSATLTILDRGLIHLPLVMRNR